MYINFTNFLHDILHYWHVIYGPKGSNALFIVIAWIKFEMAIVRVGSICLFICNRKTCLCI